MAVLDKQWLRLYVQPFGSVLPERVRPPGEIVGAVLPEAAQRVGLSDKCLVCAGTTGDLSGIILPWMQHDGARPGCSDCLL